MHHFIIMYINILSHHLLECIKRDKYIKMQFKKKKVH